jgi:hypothetical protein
MHYKDAVLSAAADSTHEQLKQQFPKNDVCMHMHGTLARTPTHLHTPTHKYIHTYTHIYVAVHVLASFMSSFMP